jgi:5'-nucleotidase
MSIQILLTNDDGIRSPGLWAAAQSLSSLGFVHVVAPRNQFSGAGRSLPGASSGVIEVQEMHVNGRPWKVYAVDGTPAQAVLHARLEILPLAPDLLVSGINYGENIGTDVTISGTVGAALEGAALGIPALAVSLETEAQHHYSYSNDVDFSAAAYFTAYFGRLILKGCFPSEVAVLKVDVPCNATPQTAWAITRQSRQRYFVPIPPHRASWNVPAKVGYQHIADRDEDEPGSDAYALRVKRIVSATPLSVDMTAPIDLGEFETRLRASAEA